MAKISHYFEYIGVRFVYFIARSLSDKAAYNFGCTVGRLSHKLLKSRRMIALENLRKADSINLSELEMEETVKKVFENIGITLIEQCRFNKIGHDKVKKMIETDRFEMINDIHKKGKGGVMVTAHYGNWDLLGAWLVANGFEIDVLAREQSNPLVDRMITNLRADYGVGVIKTKTNSLREVFKSLKKNRFIGVIADQHDPSANLIMKFFGRDAAIAKGAAVFSAKYNIPLVPLLIKRLEYNRYKIIFDEPIYPDPNIDLETNIVKMSEKYLRFFEKVITEDPTQWLWTHRRWKIKR